MSMILAPTLLALAACAAAHGAEGAGDLKGRLDAHVRPYVEAGHLSGTVLVARGNEVLYERSFGLANRELDVPNTASTRYCVASITKPMTVIVASRLIEQGRLGMQDPLSRWIPDFPSAEAITVDHLLHHRSGIPHRVTTSAQETSPHTAAEMVELAKRQVLAFPPGEQEAYSSGGYAVLARVLELAGGRSYGELLDDLVFAPAGMTRSAHASQRTILPGRASSYAFAVEGLVNAPLKDYSFLVGAGSVYSTAHDLFLLMRALADGRLGTAAREALLRDGGLRWGGQTNGFKAFSDLYEDDGIAVVLTANLHTGAVDRLRDALPRLVRGEDLPLPDVPRPETVALPADALAELEGRYELRPGTVLSARAEDGALRVNDWLLLPTSGTTFFSPRDYSEVSVARDGTGRVERLDWAVGGQVFPVRRLGPLEDE
jgi:CubicO group peptidase (beta-lactamase class C family)